MISRKHWGVLGYQKVDVIYVGLVEEESRSIRPMALSA